MPLDRARMNRRLILATLSGIPFAASARPVFASTTVAGPPPPFLPAYFDDAMSFNGEPMLAQSSATGASMPSFGTADGVTSVVFALTTGDDARCDVEFARSADTLLTMAGSPARAGQVLQADANAFRVKLRTDLASVDATVFRLPNSVLTATVLQLKPDVSATQKYHDNLKALVDRWRFDQALSGGPIIVGRWSSAIHDYAQRLLAQGRKPEALTALNLLSIYSPNDFEAQIESAELTSDVKTRTDRANLVYQRAEDPNLRARAGRLLGKKELDLQSVPVLRRGEKDLQLILIPLAPCDLTLVKEASVICEKILNIPVKLKQLQTPWVFGAPNRIPMQRSIRELILQYSSMNVDFTGWTGDRYWSTLLDIANGRSPLEAYQIRQFVDNVRLRPGQVEVYSQVRRFLKAVAPCSPSDPRTMLVGVTCTPIYSSEANYVFSGGMREGAVMVDILSYDMMLAKNAGDTHEDRRRVAERLAKEMIPASLQALGIPRPADPSDPYSYSSGVERTDEKSLTLSTPTREALDKFRQDVS